MIGREVTAFGRTVHVAPLWVYCAVWLGLLALTVLSWALAHLALGALSTAIAFVIAFTKATLVVVFFMHVLEEHGPSRLTLPLAVSLVFLLALFALFDVKTRFPPAIAGENPVPRRSWRP